MAKSVTNAHKSRFPLSEVGTYFFFIIKFFLLVPTIPSKSNIVVWSIVLNVRSSFRSPLDFRQLSFDSLCIVLGTFEVIVICNYFWKVVECCCDQVEVREVIDTEWLNVIFGNGPPIINTFLVFENFYFLRTPQTYLSAAFTPLSLSHFRISKKGFTWYCLIEYAPNRKI